MKKWRKVLAIPTTMMFGAFGTIAVLVAIIPWSLAMLFGWLDELIRG